MPTNTTKPSNIQPTESQGLKDFREQSKYDKLESLGLLYDPLSYGVFLNDVKKFRRSGTKSGDEFNYYDTPTKKYFKLFFYFWNGDDEGMGVNDEGLQSGGLLAPLWEAFEDEAGNLMPTKREEIWNYTSAWSYLQLNDEVERADKLKAFVKLLSNISTSSPWYFSQIEGLSEALDRPQTMAPDFKFDESRKKISIKCLPDAYDDRIGTLLDLYKEIVWSWKMKREILPSNLRKFDMGLYIFESPITNIHNTVSTGLDSLSDSLFGATNNYASVNKDMYGSYLTSYKYIEFHNCEIDYNSGRTGLGTIDNKEGFSPEYTIDIFFDDCYENRYNEFMMRDIGDMISIDSQIIDYGVWNDGGAKIDGNPEGFVVQKDPTNTNHHVDRLYERSNVYENTSFGDAIMNELIGAGTRAVNSVVDKITLGNLHTMSLTRVGDQLKAASQGHLWSSVQAIKRYTTNQKQAKTKYVKNIGDLFEEQPQNQYVKDLGNLFKAKSVINNI